jgi:hypothetical protein
MGVEDNVIIPADDVLIAYGPANDQKKRAVSHILNPMCEQFLTISEVDKAQGSGERHYWIVSLMEPVETIPMVGMLLERFFKTYGDAWLRATIWGALRSIPDKNVALEIAEYVHKMIEKDNT